MELVSIETLLQNFLKFSGNDTDQSTVRFGSGAGPRLYKVCNILKLLFVTRVLPSRPIPPIASVTHVGSPEKRSLYSGVRRNLTIRNFITN